jgi:glycosyltransferase involved in cell wall biosynthesis
MKKKILLLSDDLRMSSGIATMSKEIVMGTIHKYDWVQLGAAIKHPEFGKIVDINDDIRKRTGVKNANLKIIPYNGYGDIGILRKLIKEEKPDAILHFTDPHYWQWLYDNEHEVRQQVPLLFYHIWDDLPDPLYNRNYYESCDWLGCISKQTYGIVHRVGKLQNGSTWKPLEDWQIKYVPHGINPETFKPLDKVSDEITKLVHGDKKYDFVLFYNNRNIRRKQPSDVIYSFKLFCDKLPKEKADKCLLLMHTAAVDENGTDLPAVIDALCPYDVKFTGLKLEQDKLNEIYNTVDCTINIANNEGFGLTTAESLMAGTPIIANVTGGLQDQMGFDFNEDDYIKVGSLHHKGKSRNLVQEGEWVEAVWPAAINLNGSVPTPYIFDDRVNDDEVAEAIMRLYKAGKKKRKAKGLKGREFMLNNLSNKIMCDKMIEGIEDTLKNWEPKKRFDLYKIV